MYCRKCGNILDDGAVFCSVCGTPVKKRGDSEPGRHSADQMEDADQSTYWADGRKGNGVGEKFVYMSPFAQEIRGLYIEPGLTSSAQEFRENGRPLKIRIIFGNGQVGTADLSGFHYSEGASLYIAFEEPIITDSCEIIIEEAQSGTENNNTCISTMFLVGEQVG